MPDISAEELARVDSFPKLVALLRDRLEWPIDEDYELEDVTFEYEPKELGLKDDETAKIREIFQLRPLVTNQPWGVFFLSFEEKQLSVTVLRRILKALVVTKRGESKDASRAAWDKSDLIFAANFGKSGERELAFVHFSDGADTGDLPVMKVLGWNAKDTKLHNEYAAEMLTSRLAWPDDESNDKAWRKQWSSAFEIGHRQVIKTSRDLALHLAGLATQIRARANELLEAEADDGPMRTMLEAFRKNLIHDLDEDGFADMFAQTICYGMLAAAISRESGALVADNMADMVPRTNPFLKELFANFLKLGGRDKRSNLDFDELGVREVVDMLQSADMPAVLRDFGDRNPKEDPVIHFYELFLKEYDPAKRMQRGVFYTPRPVVNFIVRGVDEILRTEFDLPLGLADTTTWGELAARNAKITIPDHIDPDQPFVQILDPATGTGTFLVEVIDLIHKRMVEHWNGEGKSKAEIAEAWNAYVPAHLLPRLTAFELMMAPYSIAHMKVGLKLYETGYTFDDDQRANILLTNALEAPGTAHESFDFISAALAEEAGTASELKSQSPFTVIVGNPPYASLSANLTPEMRRIVDPYRSVDGEKIVERSMLQFEKNIQDDYIKFLRIAEREVEEKFGVISLITNHGYLDAPTLRGMRSSFAGNFNFLDFVDLHGNSNKNEAKQEGREDKNVFPIKQGVAVLRAARTPKGGCASWGEIWGTGHHKEEVLFSSTWSDISTTIIKPAPETYLFHPVSESEEKHQWNEFTAVDKIFDLFSTGVETGFDNLLMQFSQAELEDEIRRFDAMSVAEKIEEFSAEKGNARKIVDAGTQLSKLLEDCHTLQKHPFDNRKILATKRLLKTNAENVFQNVTELHPALVTTRQTKEAFGSLVVGHRCGHKLVSSYDRVSVFPLWLRPTVGEEFHRPNMDVGFARLVADSTRLAFNDGIPRNEQQSMGADYRRQKAEQIGLLDQPWDGRGDLAKDFGPRDLFDWIYAILHAPSYRNRYAEFLKSAFPRIPVPEDRDTFAALVPLGRRLVALHLLKPEEEPVLKNPDIRLAGTGEARVEKGYPKYKNGKVEINANRWFEDVPKETWEFHVGGYQVCDKWLKDRAGKGGQNPRPGRVLTEEDILHYRRVVTALTETRTIMAEIDQAIEKHGGWPGAFAIGTYAEDGE